MAQQELQEGELLQLRPTQIKLFSHLVGEMWSTFKKKKLTMIVFYLMHTTQYTQAEPPTNKHLAALTCTMLQFQEVRHLKFSHMKHSLIFTLHSTNFIFLQTLVLIHNTRKPILSSTAEFRMCLAST